MFKVEVPDIGRIVRVPVSQENVLHLLPNICLSFILIDDQPYSSCVNEVISRPVRRSCNLVRQSAFSALA